MRENSDFLMKRRILSPLNTIFAVSGMVIRPRLRYTLVGPRDRTRPSGEMNLEMSQGAALGAQCV
jgi:hypothetical protein